VGSQDFENRTLPSKHWGSEEILAGPRFPIMGKMGGGPTEKNTMENYAESQPERPARATSKGKRIVGGSSFFPEISRDFSGRGSLKKIRPAVEDLALRDSAPDSRVLRVWPQLQPCLVRLGAAVRHLGWGGRNIVPRSSTSPPTRAKR